MSMTMFVVMFVIGGSGSHLPDRSCSRVRCWLYRRDNGNMRFRRRGYMSTRRGGSNMGVLMGKRDKYEYCAEKQQKSDNQGKRCASAPGNATNNHLDGWHRR